MNPDDRSVDVRAGGRWWAPLASGTDPDPRFTLANERTYLAWIRTALGLLAAALALEAFGDDILPPHLRGLSVRALLVFGGILAVAALWRWLRIEAALRHNKPLPLPHLAGVLTAFVVAVAVILIAALP